MTDSLAAATCAIYVILAFPILYLLFKHGRNGFLGWLYLFVFCGLRIISGGLGVKKSDGATASIISNIGLSPLLLATAGILHEAFVTHYHPPPLFNVNTPNKEQPRLPHLWHRQETRMGPSPLLPHPSRRRRRPNSRRIRKTATPRAAHRQGREDG